MASTSSRLETSAGNRRQSRPAGEYPPERFCLGGAGIIIGRDPVPCMGKGHGNFRPIPREAPVIRTVLLCAQPRLRVKISCQEHDGSKRCYRSGFRPQNARAKRSENSAGFPREEASCSAKPPSGPIKGKGSAGVASGASRTGPHRRPRKKREPGHPNKQRKAPPGNR